MTGSLNSLLDSAEQIDAVCDAFEAAWRSDQRPRLEEFLDQVPQTWRGKALEQLLLVESELRERAGDPVTEQELRRRFPEHAAVVSGIVAALHNASVATSVSQALTRTADHGRAAPDATPAPLPTRLGRFQIRGLVGEGAFGQVLRALDPQLDREVAIKLPRPQTLSGPGDVERFLREAKAAATMRHPNICPVYEVGTDHGRPYIVMALVPGKSLDRHLKERKEPLPPRQAALIVRKLAMALELAHQKGIVHRDLKPANIVVDEDRRDVVVMDFGLARREQRDAPRLTQSGALMGTPAYMSPEQARADHEAVGPASDIYSLGVILYELLAGQRPFTGSMAEVLGKILHVDPAAPSTLRPGIDPALEAICLKAMARRPQDRYASMRELAEALGSWAKGAGGSTLAAETRANAATQSTTAGGNASQLPLKELFSALSADLKAESDDRHARIESAMQTAVRNARLPLWKLLTATALVSLIVAAGVIFFARTPSAAVTIVIENVDLSDKTLTFLLDGEAVDPAVLESPIELAVGNHEFIVRRGETILRKFTFAVSRDAGPRIELKEEDSLVKAPAPEEKKTEVEKPVEKPIEKAPLDTTDAELALARLVIKQEGSISYTSGRLPEDIFQLLAKPQAGRDKSLPSAPPQPFKLVGIYMDGGSFSDEMYELLGQSRNLVKLHCRDMKFDDRGLEAIRHCKGVFEFYLPGTQITDAGVARLAEFPKLYQISMWGCRQVTCETLPKLPLAHLEVGYTILTDKGMERVCQLDSLQGLRVSHVQLSGQAWMNLAKLKRLEWLDLESSSIGDDQLQALYELKALRQLTLTHSRATPEGIRRLKMAIPQCEIKQ
jgi:serine/threonine protein kinase